MNDIELEAKYNIQIIDTDIQPLRVINKREWLAGSNSPVDIGIETYDFSKIIITAIIRSDIRTTAKESFEEILQQISNIVALCKKGILITNISNMQYDAVLDDYKSEKLRFDTYSLELTFKAGCKMGQEQFVEMIAQKSKPFSMSGNMESPCILEITPTAAIVKLTITGVTRDSVTKEPEPMIIKNLVSGKKVVVDGDSCIITEEGKNKFSDADFWQFPSLLPGENIITVDNTACNITIKYKPRFI